MTNIRVIKEEINLFDEIEDDNEKKEKVKTAFVFGNSIKLPFDYIPGKYLFGNPFYRSKKQ